MHQIASYGILLSKIIPSTEGFPEKGGGGGKKDEKEEGEVRGGRRWMERMDRLCPSNPYRVVTDRQADGQTEFP